MPAILVLVTAVALVGIHWMQSAAGTATGELRRQPGLVAPAPGPVKALESVAGQREAGENDRPSTLATQATHTASQTPTRHASVTKPAKPQAPLLAGAMPEAAETAAEPKSALTKRSTDRPSPAVEPDKTHADRPKKARPKRTPPAAIPPAANKETGRPRQTSKLPQPDKQTNQFYNKALTYHRNGRLSDAVRLYQQVLRSEKNHASAMLNLAAANMQQGHYDEARPLLDRLEQITPRPRGVLLNQAIAAIGTGAPQKALSDLDRAQAASDAAAWEIRFHRAVAYTHMNRPNEALALYRQVQTERPDDPVLQFNLALAYDALGLYAEALPHYEAVVNASPPPSTIDINTITRRIRTIGRYLAAAQPPAKRR